MKQQIKVAILKRLRWYSALLMALLCAAECAALFFFPLELVTHFALHIILLVSLCSFAFPRRWRYVTWALAVVTIIFAILPFSVGTKGESGTKIIAYNMHFENAHKEKEANLLLHSKADMLALLEAGGTQWQEPLHSLRQHYPHTCGHEDDSPFAMQLLSQRPLQACEVGFFDIYPYIRAVTADKRTIFLLHPPPPVSRELAQGRLNYFRDAAAAIANEENAVLVVGDLNNTPYSPTYHRFKRNARVADALPHAMPTWKPLLLALDRVLYRQGKVFATPLPWQHSDHRPIWIEWQ